MAKNTTTTGAQTNRVKRYADLAEHAKTDDAQRGLAIGRLLHIAKFGPNAQEAVDLAKLAHGTGTPEGERLQAIKRLGHLAIAAYNGTAPAKAATRETGSSHTGYRLPDIWFGDRYDSRLRTADITKLLREEIKLSRKVGKIPSDGNPALVDLIADAPATIKFSVRTPHYGSIRIELSGVPKEWGWTFGSDWKRPWMGEHWMETPALEALKKQLSVMMNSYNYDGSDPMVDHFNTNFYGNVEVKYEDVPR